MVRGTMHDDGTGPAATCKNGPRWGRRCGRPALLIAGVMVLTGCVSVDPRADLQQARDAISRQTGVAEVYDPQTEDIIAQRTQQLLQDGLSVNEAVQISLLNNRGFQALFQEIGASRADVVQSQLISNPSLSLLFKFPEGGGRSLMEFGLAQELVDLWQMPVRRKIAEAQLQQTIAMIVQRAVELAGEVRTQYYQALALEMAETAMRESLSLSERSVAFVEAQHRAGAVSRLDVNLARVRALDVRLELMAIGKQRRSAHIDLARLLGLMDTDRTWQLSDALPIPTQLLPLDRAVATALRERMDVRIAEHELLQAEKELIQAHLQVFPSVSIGFESERPDSRALPGRKILADTLAESISNGELTAPSIQSKAERDQERRDIVDLLMGPSVELTLPIWDQNQAQIAKARFQVEQRRKQLEDVRQSIRHEVEQAWVAADESAALVRFFQQEAMPVAEQTARDGREVYEKGEESILVLLDSQESLVSRRRAHITALGEYAAAMAELEQAVGIRFDFAVASRPMGRGPATTPSSCPAP